MVMGRVTVDVETGTVVVVGSNEDDGAEVVEVEVVSRVVSAVVWERRRVVIEAERLVG